MLRAGLAAASAVVMSWLFIVASRAGELVEFSKYLSIRGPRDFAVTSRARTEKDCFPPSSLFTAATASLARQLGSLIA
jgi:hypothetical protein